MSETIKLCAMLARAVFFENDDEAREPFVEQAMRAKREHDEMRRELAEARAERNEIEARTNELAAQCGIALVVPTLRDDEELHETSDHAIVAAMLELREEARTARRAIEQADTTRREWEVRAATSYRDGRAAGLREAAEACVEARDEYSCTFRGQLAKAGVDECHSRILALAPPAAETVNHTITATSFDGRKASPYACDALPAAETVVPRG